MQKFHAALAEPFVWESQREADREVAEQELADFRRAMGLINQ